ncbi:MAG: alpha/beta fold hydrolase [Candidatus Aenigmatarchaeota archaeon]
MTRVFIIHGWGGHPEKEWFFWLKQKLEPKGIEVHVLKMPNTDEPTIEEWVSFLREQVGEPDKNTYFVGHSIGCQTIIRYLEALPEDAKVGGAVFVSGWFTLKPIIKEEEGAEEIAEPWIKTPISWNKVRIHTKNFTAFFSDNDYYVPVENSEIFKENLGAKIIVEKNKGHFSEEDGIKQVPYVLDELLKIIKK